MSRSCAVDVDTRSDSDVAESEDCLIVLALFARYFAISSLFCQNAACACISKKLIDNLSEIFEKFQLKISRNSILPSGNRRELFYVRVLRSTLDEYNKVIRFSNNYKREKLLSILEKNGAAGI